MLVSLPPYYQPTDLTLQWYPEVLHFCPTTPIILCGLKSDLRNKKTCIDLLKTQGLTPVTPEQGKAVAVKMGATYMECSSKEMTGVDDIFDTAVTLAVGEESRPIDSRTGTGAPRMPGGKKPKKSKCKFL